MRHPCGRGEVRVAPSHSGGLNVPLIKKLLLDIWDVASLNGCSNDWVMRWSHLVMMTTSLLKLRLKRGKPLIDEMMLISTLVTQMVRMVLVVCIRLRLDPWRWMVRPLQQGCWRGRGRGQHVGRSPAHRWQRYERRSGGYGKVNLPWPITALVLLVVRARRGQGIGEFPGARVTSQKPAERK